ncbi:hypothetical protein [Nocardioides ferulae]|uniref:hypothetical protein n=1 Tax=Nocardioides ferulae TaxID=2340821 RepID=UPI000F86EE7D|nr:hypothetical protein [Nocardioides ferulae]
MRHELAMLRMVGASLRGATEAGDHTAQHARVLREIHDCPRCRRRRGEVKTMTLLVTLTCTDDADVAGLGDLEDVATVVEEALPARLPESVEAVTVKVA